MQDNEWMDRWIIHLYCIHRMRDVPNQMATKCFELFMMRVCVYCKTSQFLFSTNRSTSCCCAATLVSGLRGTQRIYRQTLTVSSSKQNGVNGEKEESSQIKGIRRQHLGRLSYNDEAENRNRVRSEILMRQQYLPLCGTKDHSEPLSPSVQPVSSWASKPCITPASQHR